MIKAAVMKVFRNEYTLSIIAKLFSFAIGLLSSVFVTRYLGVVNKGSYTYICQVANILVIVCNFGIYQSYSYNIKKGIEGIQKKYSDICGLQLLVLLAGAMIISICAGDLEITLAMILIPFNVIRLQYENIMLIENIRFKFRMQMINSVLITLAYAVLLFEFESSVVAVVAVTVAVDLQTVSVYMLKLKVVPRFWQVDRTFLSSVLRFGFIPMLSALLLTLNYSVDILFLRNMGTDIELGLYSLAVNIVNYVWLIPDAFKEVLFSKSARTLDRKNIAFSLQVSLAFVLTCFIGFVVIGKLFIRMMYGVEFIGAWGAAILLIAGAFSMSIYKIVGIVLVSQGKRNIQFISLAISAVVNIVMNCLLIPKMGMMGAAWASIASYTICAGLLLIYFMKVFSFSFRELFVPDRQMLAALVSRVSPKGK